MDINEVNKMDLETKSAIVAIVLSVIIIAIGALVMKVVQDSIAPVTETFDITNHTTPQAFITKHPINEIKSLQIYNVTTNSWYNLSGDYLGHGNTYIGYGYFVIDSPIFEDANYTKIKITYSLYTDICLRGVNHERI